MEKGSHAKISQIMRVIRRCTAVFLILIFTLVDLLQYVPDSYANSALIATESALNSSLIPENMGRVEEVFRGSSGKTIFFIQDAHDSLEAQENIASMITKLVKDRGIKTVFEEGYEGLVPTDNFFGFIKNSKIKQKVSYFLLDKLRLSGAEYAHINRADDFKLIGVENLKLYGKNIEYYKEASKHREEVSKDLEALFTEISNLANQHFPGNLRALLKTNKRFSDDKLPLLNYLRKLQRFYQKSPLDNRAELFSKKYPSISILLMAETIAEPLLTKQLNEMDFKAVFSEILQLEQDISRAYLGAERDRKIFTYYQALQLLMKLNQIKLTPSEYEAVKKIFQDFDTKQLAEFVVSLTGRSLVLSKEWEANIESSALFYDIAQERDKTISHHMKSFFQSENESAAILVFGGFHASGIKEILREHQISYQVISPRINSFSKKHQGYYQHLMAGGQHSFEKTFMSARAARPPSIYFTAAMVGEESPIQSELREIVATVDVGSDYDSLRIERHLAGFSAQQKLQSLEEVSISGVRSEMRTEAEGIKEIVEKAYGLHVNGVPEVLTGGLGKRMNHEPYVIKTRERGRLAFKFLFKDQERARYAVEFMQRLREFDLPVPELVPRLDVTVSDDPKDVYIMEYRDAFYVLETFLSEGSEILREDATEEHFREVGKLAARIQNAVEGFEPRHMFSYKTRRVVFEKIKDGFSEMEKAMDSLAVVHGPENELVRDALRRREQIRGLVETHLDYTGRNFPRSGLRFTHIHNDLHLGNLKFSKHGSISALFDFNLVQADHRIAEFNNLVFSITGYGFAVFRPEMFRAVLAGYEQTLNVPLTPEEKVAIWESLRLRFIQEVTRVYSTKPDAAESIFRDRDAKRGWYQSLDALMHFAPEPFIYDGRSVLEVGGTHHAGDKQRSEARGNRARDWEERPSIGKLWEFIKLLTINNWKIPEILPPENEEIDYIVAIGASISKDGSASTHSRAVAEQAVNLYRRYRAKGQIPKIIFSGGYSQNGVSEAESMRRIALTMEPGGASDFIKDRAPNLRLGTKTQFPAIFEAIEKDQSITGPRDKIINVIGVTQYLHSRRVISLLRYYLGLSGIKVWQSPAPKSEYEENSTQWQLRNPKKGFWTVIKFVGENRFFVWEVLNYFRYIQNARRLADEPKQMAEMRRLIIAAHRGGTPGNDTAQDISLEAVKKSVALGVDAVEFDVQMTRDGYIVSSHAEKLDGKAISSMTFAEVKALVPDISKIDDIYDVVKDSQARFHIHVVWTKNKLRKVFLQKLAHFLKEKEIVERSLIISFYPEDLQLMYQYLPELKRDRVFFKEELWEAIAKKQQDPQMLVKEAGKAKADYITWPRQVEPDAELIGELKKAGIGIDIGPKEEYLTVIDIQRYQNMGADILTILDPEWDPYAEDFGGRFQAKYPNKHIYPRARLAPRVAEQLSNSKYRQIYDLVAGLFGVEEDDDQARLLRGKRLLADVYASPNKEQFIEKTFEAAKVHTFVASSKQRFYPLMVIMGNLRKGRSLFSARTIDELPPNQDKNNPQEYLSTRHLVYAENPKGEDIPDLQLQSPVSFNGKDKIKMLDIGSAPKEHGSMPLNSLMRVFRSWGIEPEIHGTDQFFPVFKTNQEGDIVPESDYYFESDGSFLGKEGIRYWNTQKSPKANVLNNDFGLGKFDVITLSKVLHHLTVDKDTYAPKPLSTWNLIYSKENRIQGPFSELYGITETQQQVIDRLLDSLAEGGILFLNLSYALWPAGKENDQYKAAHRESLVDKNNSDTFIMIQRKDAHSFWIYDEVMPFRSELDSLSSLEMVFMQRKTIDEWFFGGDESQRPSETVFTRLSSQMEKDAELRNETEEIFRKADLLAYRHQRLNRSVWGQIFLSLEVRDQRKSLTDLLSKYLEYVPDKHPVKKDLLVRAQKLDHRMGTTGGIAGSVSSKHRSEVRGEPKENGSDQKAKASQNGQQSRSFISTSVFKWLRVFLLFGVMGIMQLGCEQAEKSSRQIGEQEPPLNVIELLEGKNKDNRYQKEKILEEIQVLGLVQNKQAVATLFEVLKILDVSGYRYDYEVREEFKLAAGHALVQIGGNEVIDGFIDLWMKEEISDDFAVEHLSKLGEVVSEALIKIVESNEFPGKTHEIIESLGVIGDERAYDYLTDFILNIYKNKGGKNSAYEDRRLRDSALESLGMIQTAESAQFILNFYKNSEMEKHSYGFGSSTYLGRNYSLEEECRNALVQIGKPAESILLSNLHESDDVEIQVFAIEILGQIKSDAAVSTMISILDDSTKDLKVKQATIAALGKIKSEKSVGPMIKTLSHSNKDIVSKAITALAEIGDLALPELIAALKKSSPEIQIKIISIFRTLENKKSTAALADLLESSGPDVQAAIALALGSIQDERAIPSLVKAANSSSVDLQTMANIAWAFGKIGHFSPEVIQILKSLWSHPDMVMREIAVIASLEMPDAQDDPAFRTARISVVLHNFMIEMKEEHPNGERVNLAIENLWHLKLPKLWSLF